MTKSELLEIIKLLSGLESWGLCQQKRLPWHLQEKILDAIKILSKDVLEKKE